MPFLREKTGHWSPEKIVAFGVVLVPILWLVGRTLMGDLGARPVTEAIHFTGRWSVRFILLALAISPARRLFNWPKLLHARRTLGVAAAAYAVLHLMLYVLDQKFDLLKVASEIVLRFYLTIGFAALIGLITLGITSTDAWVRRLGPRWTTLHRAAYLIGILAVVHFALQKKLEIYEPTLMMGLLFWLLGWRILNRYRVGTGTLSLFVLALLASAFTAFFEATWYGFLTGVEFTRVLEFNLMFDYVITPMWWVLAAGFAVGTLLYLALAWAAVAVCGGAWVGRGALLATVAVSVVLAGVWLAAPPMGTAVQGAQTADTVCQS
jgi:methionine sulfoxide reductase heme-binding subunit